MKPIGKIFYLYLAFLLILLSSCAEDSGSTISSINEPASGSGEYFHVDKIGGEGEFLYTHDVGSTAKDLYFIFTNNSSVSTTVAKVSSQNGGEAFASVMQKSITAEPDLLEYAREHGIALRGKPEVTEFNANPPAFEYSDSFRNLQSNVANPLFAVSDSTEDINNFNTLDGVIPTTTTATLRLKKISTDSNVTVNIWVANDAWGSCLKHYCMNQTMAEEFAGRFIKTDGDNDIYDWVTNIFGLPWGSHTDTNLIDASSASQIDILFLDIDNDGNKNEVKLDGGVVGYFYSQDNYKSSRLPNSNERLLFYMDSVFSARPDVTDSWTINDYWPSEMVSTLAHEFQHMIHFYQKNVIQNVSSDIWLNEMASLVTEDFLAKKLGIIGPRGVDSSIGNAGSSENISGRIPLFNYYSYTSVTEWNNSSINYSINYAFGAYLARNFGGALLFQKIVQNEYGTYKAVEQALSDMGYSLTFAQLLQQWGTAVMLSDQTDMDVGYRYNTGNYFESSLNGIDYSLGSINFFNYSAGTLTGPGIYSESGLASLSAQYKTSNIYVKMAESVTGSYSKTIDLPANVKLTVVTK